MNLKLEVFLHVPEETFSAEGIAGVSINLADLIVLLGFGNVAPPEGEEVKLSSVVVVRPFEEEIDDAWWDEQAKGAMAINFPTNDEGFLEQARKGGIPGQ